MARFRLALLLAGVLIGSIAGTLVWLSAPAGADTGADAARFLALTNRARAAQGVAPLSSDGLLTGLAKNWSNHLAAADALSHNPSLGSEVSGWRSLGENVGMGPSVDGIQQAFINSPEHYRNIMDGAYSIVGIAVTYSNSGVVFVTLDFEQPMAAAAPTAPLRPAPVVRPAARAPAAAPVVRPAAPAPVPAAAPAPAAPAAAPAPVPAPSMRSFRPDANLPATDGGPGGPAEPGPSVVVAHLSRIGGRAETPVIAIASIAMFAMLLLSLAGTPALTRPLPVPVRTRR